MMSSCESDSQWVKIYHINFFFFFENVPHKIVMKNNIVNGVVLKLL